MNTLLKEKIRFKKDHVSKDEIFKISPVLNHIFFYFVQYAYEYDLPIKLTSVLGDAVGRTSKTHCEGRAIDISTMNWEKFHCTRVTAKLNTKFAKDFGTSPVGGTPRVCVYGDSKHLDHFHLQIRQGLVLFD